MLSYRCKKLLLSWDGDYEETTQRLNDPHRNFYAAILQRAIDDLGPVVLNNIHKQHWGNVSYRSIIRSALAFFSNHHKYLTDSCVTFPHICDILNLDPAHVRKSIGFDEVYRKYWPLVSEPDKPSIEVLCQAINKRLEHPKT